LGRRKLEHEEYIDNVKHFNYFVAIK